MTSTTALDRAVREAIPERERAILYANIRRVWRPLLPEPHSPGITAIRSRYRKIVESETESAPLAFCEQTKARPR